MSVLAVSALPVAGAGTARSAQEARVREAMLRVYYHGVTDQLAREVLGLRDVPVLRSLLADHDFPRRDNIVAFLAHLDDGASTRDLLGFLSDPPAPVDRPEEDRSLLLAPRALGRIAARGDRAALDALLDMTRHGGGGGVLARAAARGRDPIPLRDDLIESAVRGLALTGAPEARQRLRGIAGRSIRPDAAGRDLAGPAGEALREFDETWPGRGGAAVRKPQTAAGRAVDGSLTGGAAPGTSSITGGFVPEIWDATTTLHDIRLTYANHVKLSTIMNDARLDPVLAEATLRAGTENYSDDLACCVQVSRQGSALSFGSPTDALDIIDNSTELNTVLNNSIARVKVVRQINYCGGTGSNIIGCAWVGGNGMSLVRMSALADEAVLWIHEYGHNAGMMHVADSRNIMYGIDTGLNNVLTQDQCNLYHSPVPQTGLNPVAIGFCTDDDADGVRDSGDNCLNLYNPAQTNTDGDTMGDDCDPDDDNDTFLDGSDCAPVAAAAWRLPNEATGLDLTRDQGETSLSWLAPSDLGGTAAGIRYDVLMSGGPVDFLTAAACVETDDGPAPVSISAPVPARLWFGESGQLNGQYGEAVVSGDFNGDGRADVASGAPLFFNADGPAGAVSVYLGTPGGIPASFSTRIVSNQEFSSLGASLAAGDVDNDGYDDLLVGAPLYDDGFGGGGAVLVHPGSALGVSTTASLILSAGQFDADFGRSIASGDVNGDGFADLIVGAPLYTGTLSGEGRAFVYLGSAAGLSTSPVWTFSGGQASAWLGWSVASAGDVNGDGFDDVVVGSPLYDNGQANEGRALLFAGSASGPGTAPIWTFESDQALAEAGRSVGSAGDVDGDGDDEVLVGAPMYDDTAADEGRAWLFPGSPAGPDASPAWMTDGLQAGAMLGSTLARGGDLSGDGLSDVLVGVPGYDDAAVNTGRVYVYLGSSLGLDPVAALRFQSDQSQSGFSKGLAAASDVSGDGRREILIGAPGYDNSRADEGRAFLYPGSGDLIPAAGQTYYYLIRSRNVCGTGPPGFDSAGAPHGPARTCP